MTSATERVRAYLAAQKPVARRTLSMMRRTIRAAAPEAVEVFSYGIPGFKIGGQPLLWFAAWKAHTSLYPVGPEIRASLGPAAARYGGAKGTIKFPLDDPPTPALVRRIVKARLARLRSR